MRSTGYATLTVGGAHGLYTVDRANARATLVGALPAALRGFALLPADTTAPTLTVTGAKTKLSLSALLKGLKLTLTPDEAAALELSLLAKPKRVSLRRAGAFNLTIASLSLELAAGERSAKLKPKKKLVGRPERALKVLLAIEATRSRPPTAPATRRPPSRRSR